MSPHFTAIARVWLAALFFCLWPLAAFASGIEVTSAPQLEISEQVSWCATDPAMGVEEVAAGGCEFRAAKLSDLAPGFSAQAFWLRLDLHNPGGHETEHWLRVGHPRLERVSLFEKGPDNIWQRTDTGIAVPLALSPVATSNPVLPLQLKAGERKTVYVRVASETTIDLSLTLWKPYAFFAAHQHVEVMQALSLGGLMAVVMFALTVYFKWRDRLYLFFGVHILFLMVLNASYTGLMRVHFWPTESVFDLQLLAISPGGTLLFFVLFVREFIGDMPRYRRYYLTQWVSLGVLLLVILWACLVSFGDAVEFVYLGALGVLLSCIALLFVSWRSGFKPAGYLLAAYFIWLLLLTYRTAVAFGGSNFTDLSDLSFSLRFLVVTPVILAAIHLRSQKLRDATRQAAARVQFLAQMSHEFRTPLNIMLGYAELLERNSKRITVQEGASSIKRSGRYLLGMIDEILDHARGEAGKLELSIAQVQWADFVEALEQSTAMVLRPRGNRFELKQANGMPQVLMLDERRLRQVLDVLISNANRYTQHGSITLSCTASSVSNKRSLLTFSVSDSGSGIAPQELAHIFQPFVRGSAGQASGIDGSGMGLSVAHQLVKLMGGEIGVESQLGKGSRFFFSIECELGEAQPQAAAIQKYSKLRQTCTVLVADDDPDNCQLLTLLLADCGFNVITAATGNAAQQFLGHQVDLVITDQFMPDGDGWSVLRDWAVRHVPAILLSAAPPQRPRDFPPTLNFVAIQLKPFSADALLGEISKVLALEWEAAKPLAAPDESKRPPLELLAPLRLMIEDGAVTDIAEWLEIFVGRHPEYHAYCAKIAACNLALDFDALRNLTGTSSA